MATLGTTGISLAELIKRENPDGSMAELVDVIAKVTPIASEGYWEACNNRTYHEATRVASKPAGTERAYGMGVSGEVAATEKVTEPTCMLASMCTVDAKLIENEGGVGKLNQEEGLFVSGMLETVAGRLITGDRSTYGMQINGINNRSDYNALSSDYVYDNAGGDASATANKTSIYIIQYGPKMVSLIAPSGEGSKTITRRPFPVTLVSQSGTSDAKKFPAYQTWFEIQFGIFIYDPRCIKRIVNISTSNIDGVDDFSFDENLLTDAICDLEYQGRGAVIYVNRTIMKQMTRRANEKGNTLFQLEKGADTAFPTAGKILSCNGIPIHREDSITDTQATVS